MYVSSLKLLLSAIDTFAFLEFGDTRNNFKNWLNEFCNLSELKITEEELWEFRNSLLHMTNTVSRKVQNESVIGLGFYVFNEDIEERTSDGKIKYFNLKSLIVNVAFGLKSWAESFNNNRGKFEQFIERYDLVISDTRYKRIIYK